VTLSSGKGAVMFRPRSQPAAVAADRGEGPNGGLGQKQKRRGKVLEEVVVGKGGARKSMSGRDRALAAGLLGGGTEVAPAVDGAGAVADCEGDDFNAEMRKAKRRKKAAERKPRGVALAHLAGEEYDED
jgi:hypothetical protein